MNKHLLVLLFVVVVLCPTCDILNSPGQTVKTGGSCEVEIVSHSYSYEVRVDGKKWVYFKVKIWNRGTLSCKCTLTIVIYGKNDSLLEKKDTSFGVVNAGETKEQIIYTNVLYDDLRRYSIELKCDPAGNGLFMN